MRRRIALSICSLALIFSSACSSDGVTSPIAAHVLWLNKGPSDYTFNVAVSLAQYDASWAIPFTTRLVIQTQTHPSSL